MVVDPAPCWIPFAVNPTIADGVNNSGNGSVIVTFPVPQVVLTQYGFVGAAQSFTVPQGVTALSVVASGAQGGTAENVKNGQVPGTGGPGAVVNGSFAVTPGETVQVVVGGQGQSLDQARAGGNPPPGAGGFNGGGVGGASDMISGAGGGGATTVVATSATIVAGGGGGGGGATAALTGAYGGTGGQVGTAGGSENAPPPSGANPGAPGGQGGGGGAGVDTFGGTNGSNGSSGVPGVGGAGGPGQCGAGGGGGGGATGGGGGGGFTAPEVTPGKLNNCVAAFPDSNSAGGGGGSSSGPLGATFSVPPAGNAGDGVVTVIYAPATPAPAAPAPGPGPVQPDAQIRVGSSGPFAGVKAFAPAPQSATGSLDGSGTAHFELRLENAGSVGDRFTVKGPPQVGGLLARYLDGASDVTDAVAGGTYTTPVLAPASSHTLTMVAGGPASHPAATFTMSATSTADPSVADRVDAVVVPRGALARTGGDARTWPLALVLLAASLIVAVIRRWADPAPTRSG